MEKLEILYNRTPMTIFIAVLVVLLLSAGAAYADVGGTVFRDYDADGIQDTTEPGVQGVTVTAYDADGNVVGSPATTAFDGSYTLTLGAGDYRIEVTGLPSYLEPGPCGTDSESTVAFASNGATGVDIGLANPGQHCEANPLIAVATHRNGSGSGNTATGYVSFDYNSSGVPTAFGGSAANPTQDAQVQQVGAVWGASYQPTQERLFSAAFLKRHVGFAAQGPGGVYALDYSSGSGSVAGGFSLQGVSPLNGGPNIDLGTVTRSGSSDYTLPVNQANPSVDLDAFGKVGTMSYGDIDLTEDGNTLWLVNLYQQALISVDVTGATASLPGNVYQYPLGSISGLPSCTGGQFRPWALKFHDGRGYLGGVCSAETGKNRTNLDAYVLSFDPGNIGAGFTTEVSFDLDFNREAADHHLPANPQYHDYGDWQPWAMLWNETGHTGANIGNVSYAQPILSDIEFTADGSMDLGFIDRFAHQAAHQNYTALTGSTDTFSVRSAGDILHLCNVNGSLVMEGQPGCPDSDTDTGVLGWRGDDGPSNTGEFYYQENFVTWTHHELASGALAVLLTTNEVVSTAYDPVDSSEIAGNGAFTQGIQWYNTTNGQKTDAYTVVDNQNLATFGKASGLGDIELLCEAAPLEIGNRVWCDEDGNGVQDPGEGVPSAGLTVNLVCDIDNNGIGSGTDLTASTTTNASGQYFFNATTVGQAVPTNTDCRVQVNLSGANATNLVAACGSVIPTTENYASNSGTTDLHDSDGDDGTIATNYTSVDFTTGGAGHNDHTFDFGIVGVDMGDLPDSFDTTTSNSGPSHVIVRTLFLGSCVDSEGNGQPDGVAGTGTSGGDDNNPGLSTTGTCATAGDDEDGVTLVTPLIPGYRACVEVDAVNTTGGSAVLQGWINFNGDDNFDGDPEDALVFNRIGGVAFGPSANATVASGGVSNVEYCFNVPLGATFAGGETHLRFRLSTAGGLSWNGPAANGEVEDYYTPLACVGNLVWWDESEDNTQASESTSHGINNIGVNLVWFGPNGSEGGGDDVTYNATTSGGIYGFCGLTPNTNYWTEIPTPPAAYPQAVTPEQGGNDNTDSDCTQAGGSGTAVTGPNFTINSPIALPTGENGIGDNPGSINGFPDPQDNLTFDCGFVVEQTAVELSSFEAETQGNDILLTWQTASELDNLGFNLYRAESAAGARAQINGNLIPAQAPGSAAGASYQFVDESAAPGTTYYYWIEAVDVHGASAFYGPVSGQVQPLRRLLPARPRLAPLAPVLRNK